MADVSGGDWTLQEIDDFLKGILAKTQAVQKKSYKAVESSLKWEDFTVPGKTTEECQQVYQKAISKVRKYRTMPEILQDALELLKKDGFSLDTKQQYPDMPKKPPTAFGIFMRKKSKKLAQSGVHARDRMALLSKEWNALPEIKKEVYKQKYLKQKKKYEEEMEIFRKNHPDAPVAGSGATSSKPQPPQPSRLFVDSRMKKEQEKHPDLSHSELLKKLQRKYDKLSDKKKLKWINRAKDMLSTYQEQCEAYNSQYPGVQLKPAVLHLNKKEQQILDTSVGKPVVAPPKNVFRFYCNTKRDTVSHLSIAEQSKKLSTAYHQLSEDELREIKHQFQLGIESYIKQYEQYYQSLGEEEKAGEKSPEVTLADYHKILQKKTRTSAGGSNSPLTARQPKNQKQKPRHGENHTVSNSEPSEEENSSTPPSSQQPMSQGKRKRKSEDPDASPTKKKHRQDTTGTPEFNSTNGSSTRKSKKLKTEKSELQVSSPEKQASPQKSDMVIKDNLLAMWSPLVSENKGKASQEDQTLNNTSLKEERKSPKKTKKKSKNPGV